MPGQELERRLDLAGGTPVQPQLVGDLGERVAAQVVHLDQRGPPQDRGELRVRRRGFSVCQQEGAEARQPAWIGKSVAEELTESFAGRAVAELDQLGWLDRRAGEMHGVAGFVEERPVVVEPAHRLDREAHVARRVDRVDERARPLARVEAVVDLDVPQAEADAGEERLQRLELEALVKIRREPRRLPQPPPVRLVHLFARDAQFLARDPIQRGAEDALGRLHVRHALHEQRRELHLPLLLGERDVVGETGLARGVLRGVFLAFEDRIERRDADRVHRGEGLPAARRVGLLRDQTLHVAEGERLVAPGEGDGRTGLGVGVLVVELRHRQADDLAGQRALQERQREHLVTLRAPLRSRDRIERRALEEAIVAEVGQLRQRGLTLRRCVPAEDRLDAAHRPVLVAQRLNEGRRLGVDPRPRMENVFTRRLGRHRLRRGGARREQQERESH